MFKALRAPSSSNRSTTRWSSPDCRDIKCEIQHLTACRRLEVKAITKNTIQTGRTAQSAKSFYYTTPVLESHH